MRELYNVKQSLSQLQKVQSVRMERQFTLEPLSASSYFLPISETAEDILVNFNEKITSPQANMKAKKLSKLHPALTVRSLKYYSFKGDSSSQVLLLPHCITELLDIRSYDCLSRMDATHHLCDGRG